MKNFRINIILVAVAVALSFFTSCRFGCIKGSGKDVTENRKVNDFTKLDISGGYTVNLKQDSTLALQITGDEKFMKYVRTEVSGNKLRIFSRKNFCGSNVVINIGVKGLSEIKSSGAIELNTQGKLTAQDLKLALSGASKLNMDLNAGTVTTTGSGATEITLTGQAGTHNIKPSGAGKLHALDFIVGDYKINTSGASNCQINVLKTLDVKTSGASEITYRGNPSSINNNKSGASSITKAE
jgi:hypothetical protein